MPEVRALSGDMSYENSDTFVYGQAEQKKITEGDNRTQRMFVIIGKVISIFAIMLVGFVAYKFGVLGTDAVRPMTALLMNITCPCLIVSSLYSKEISSSMVGDTVAVMACVMLFYIISSTLAYCFVRFAKIGNTEDRGVYIVAVAATNSGFMGFPIIKSLYGSDMLYLMVMGNMMLNVYLMWLEPSILTIGTDSRASAKDLIRTLKSPLVLSIFIGFFMMFLHIKPEGVINETIVMIGDVTIPLSMILVGIRLGSVRFGEIISKSNILISLFAMIPIPALTFLLIYPMGFISNEAKIIIVMTAAMPTAVVAAVVSEQCKKNSLLLSEIVSLTTLISVITIPLTAVLLGMIYTGF